MSKAGSFSASISCRHNPAVSARPLQSQTGGVEGFQELPFPVCSESLEGCRRYLRVNSEGNHCSALERTLSVTLPHHARRFLFSGLWFKGGDCAAVFNAQHALFSVRSPGYELYPGFGYVWI